MAGNTTGSLFRLTTFGESHGMAIGGIIDGCPAGLNLDLGAIQNALDRRKPGQSSISTQRKESDTVQFQSGVLDYTTLGTPIGFIIPNEDARGKDYDHLKDTFRPSHADYTYEKKYGIRDHRGGGRSSARETACRVVAGEIARQLLETQGVEVKAYVSRVGDIEIQTEPSQLDLSLVEQTVVRCPEISTANKMIAAIEEARKAGNTLGGAVQCIAKNISTGWGEPVFDKLHADLAKSVMSINATRYFEIGSGKAGTYMSGSEHNDQFVASEGRISTATNRSGGIQGGISNGEDIYFEVGFKPVATILQKQASVDREGKVVELEGKGRHDPCVLPRAVPIVEAMALLTLADAYLRSLTNKV